MIEIAPALMCHFISTRLYITKDQIKYAIKSYPYMLAFGTLLILLHRQYDCMNTNTFVSVNFYRLYVLVNVNRIFLIEMLQLEHNYDYF